MRRIAIVGSLAIGISACADGVEIAPPLPVTSATVQSPAVATSLASTVELRPHVIPNHDALPHAVVLGTDGALWFTEANANAIGRLDPNGAFREFPLPEPDSRPHQLTLDRDGNLWFTASARGYIGKLEPSGAVTSYRIPDARAKDPHSLVFAPDGSLWFTVLKASSVGRLDPSTGQIKLLLVDRPGAQPYDIVIGPDGAPYFSEYVLSVIQRVDPRTMAVRSIQLPPGAQARQLAVAGDGALFYTDYARGKLARLDTISGRVEEWTPPNGVASQPYGLAVAHDGSVWLAETGPRPNTLLRFDPTTHAFQSMPMPPDSGVVRKLWASPDGRLFIASGSDRITEVRPRLAVSSR